MKTNERHAEIINILNRIPFTTVSYLADEIHISPSSIRRDLAILEAQGVVHRTHGGVSLVITGSQHIPFALRVKKNTPAKKKIAQKAISLIHDGDIIFLDSSSTCMMLAQELVKMNDITIVTNSVSALYFLADYNVKVICTGGTPLRVSRNTLVGDEVIRMLDGIRADLAFISPQVIDDEYNLLNCDWETVTVVRKMLSRANKKIALCDSSKLNKISTYKICSLSQIDVLISEVDLTDVYSDKFPEVKMY